MGLNDRVTQQLNVSRTNAFDVMTDSESNGASAASAGKKVNKKTNRSAGQRLHQLGQMRHDPS
jgi:hypothetical protein